MVVITPALLAPVNLVTLDGRITGFTRWLVAFLAASVVDIAIVFVAFADGSLLPQQPAEQLAPQAPKIARKLPARKVSKEQLLAYLASNPGASNGEIARNFHVTRQAIASRRKQLTPVDLGLAKDTSHGNAK